MIKRKDETKWKNNECQSEFKVYYNNQGIIMIHDTLRPSVSYAYAFILNNKSSQYEVKTVKVTLTHN